MVVSAWRSILGLPNVAFAHVENRQRSSRGQSILRAKLRKEGRACPAPARVFASPPAWTHGSIRRNTPALRRGTRISSATPAAARPTMQSAHGSSPTNCSARRSGSSSITSIAAWSCSRTKLSPTCSMTTLRRPHSMEEMVQPASQGRPRRGHFHQRAHDQELGSGRRAGRAAYPRASARASQRADLRLCLR